MGLWKLLDGRDWKRGKLGLVLMGGAMLSKSLIQYSVFPPCYLTWGQTMVEVMKMMAASFKGSHTRTAMLSAPDPAADHRQPMPLRDSWTLMRKSGSVSCGVTAPFSWVLVHTRFCFYPPSVCSPVLCKFWWLYGGLMTTSSKRAYAIPRSAAPEPLPLRQSTADLHLHPNTVLAQSLWGLWVLVLTRCVWALWASLVGMGFDSKRNLAPPTILLGLLLCPWTLDISSKSLQCHAATIPMSVILLGLLCP